MNSPPFNPLKDRTSRPGVGGGLKNDTTKRHAAAGSDACRWYSGDGERPATAAWWWRKTCGGTCRPAGRAAFRTGAAHGSAANVRAADVGASHVSAANGATNGAAHGTATHAAKCAAPYGDTARQCTTHGIATHTAAVGQPDCPAAAIPSGARVASTGATVGAGTFASTFKCAGADETAASGQYAGQLT